VISLFLVFLKIGFFAFGGGYGALSLIQDEIVYVNQWLDLETFIDLVSVSQMTPGPIAINSATFIGYQLHGVGGAILATAGVLLPGILWVSLLLKLLSLVSKKYETSRIFEALRVGIIALIIAAALRIGMDAITGIFTSVFFLVTFLVMLRYKPPVFWVIIGTGMIGVIVELISNGPLF
jgi:chromate transporter